MTVARCTIPALAVCLAWLSVSGQAQQPTTPAFDVVSVRPNTSTDGIIDIPPTPPEGVVLHNRSVADVVRYAYQLPSFLVFGLPRWTEDERFDIVAKAARPITEPERQAMVRTLLADRFRLKAHVETRTQTVYVMTRARTDGPLGSGLRPRADCVTNPCQRSGSSSRIAGVIRVRGTTIAGLAEGPMSSILDQVIRDETGVHGAFDAQLSFRPDTAEPKDSRPSFFTAVEEQFGLKLTPQKEPVEALVIDSVERPTPD
jgi:uncharacterized protein (TIGR03435 family)